MKEIGILPRLLLLICTTGLFFSFTDYLAYKNIFADGGLNLNYEFSNYLPADSSWQSEYNTDSQYEIDALHYSLNLGIDFPAKSVEGQCDILFVSASKLDTVTLNFHNNMSLRSVEFGGRKIDYRRTEDKLVLLTAIAPGDTGRISISYFGTPRRLSQGSFTFGRMNGYSVVSTLNQPNFASAWYPCFDRPDDKALFDIKITNDIQFTSVSNGRLVSVDTTGTRSTYYWKTVYPVSTYLTALYSGEYVKFTEEYISVSGDTIPIEYYVTPDKEEKARYEWSKHKKMFAFLEKTLGPYPFPEEKYGVAGFMWLGGAMENQTITGVGLNLIEGNDDMETTYLHELAHHWWGNSVGPKSWKDIWLNEGFATYFEMLYLIDDTQISSPCEYLRPLNVTVSDISLYNPPFERMFSGFIYNRGAWVLHMLRYTLGDSLFYKSLKQYYHAFQYKNASTADFQKICESVSGRGLLWFFNQYVYTPSDAPMIEYSVSAAKDKRDKYVISFDTSSLSGTMRYGFDVKLVYDGFEKVISIELTKDSHSFVLPESVPPLFVYPDYNCNFYGSFSNVGLNR